MTDPSIAEQVRANVAASRLARERSIPLTREQKRFERTYVMPALQFQLAMMGNAYMMVGDASGRPVGVLSDPYLGPSPVLAAIPPISLKASITKFADALLKHGARPKFSPNQMPRTRRPKLALPR